MSILDKNCNLISDDLEMVKLYDYKKPMELFSESNMVKICAPMVRYTK
jgi:hypothetical protein